MQDLSSKSLKDKLGLIDQMSTYFLRAPQEYWQELGFKQAPYDDNSGEYDFIHAFFTSKIEMSNFADILISKLAFDGMMWISWPKLSSQSDITEQDIRGVFAPFGLSKKDDCSVTKDWLGIKLVWQKGLNQYPPAGTP